MRQSVYWRLGVVVLVLAGNAWAANVDVHSTWSRNVTGVNTRNYNGSGNNWSSNWTNLGDGNKTFSPAFTGIEAVDYDQNGNRDVLVTWQRGEDSGVDWLEWNGTGWANKGTEMTWSNAGAGNGYTDITVGMLPGQNVPVALLAYTSSSGNSGVAMKMYNGSGWQNVYSSIPTFDRSYLKWTGIDSGDFDGDANVDVLMAWQSNSGNSGVSWFECVPETSEFVSRGDLFSWSAGVGYGYTGVTMGDLDGDDDVDVLTTWKSSSGNSAISWREFNSTDSSTNMGTVPGSDWGVGADMGRTGIVFADSGATIPEPATMSFLGIGAVGGLVRRKTR